MPEVLEGAQPGLTVNKVTLRIANRFGLSPDSPRIQNIVKEWINDVLRDIQLSDPKKRRTLVYNAPFTLIAGQMEYDVRRSEEDGGFGWTNCFEVAGLVLSELDDRPLQAISLEQFRERRQQVADSGPPDAWVSLDQFRVVIMSAPDQAYSGVGDYYQDIPELTAGDALIDWPRAWDAVLMAGVEFEAAKWKFMQQPGAWVPFQRIYEDRKDKLKTHDVTNPAQPGSVVYLRRRRSNRRLFHDNSVDRGRR